MNKKKRIDALIYKFNYELADGIHTYHQCGCGRTQTRAGKCIICIAEAIVDIKKGKK